MIIQTIKTFVILLVSVWLGVQLYQDPGYVLISINKWSIEATLGLFIPVVILSFIITHMILRVLHWLIHSPSTWKAWAAKRRALNAQKKTRQGLIEFSEGHWLQAKNHLINALPDTDAPLLNYLTAARAAQEMGDSKLRDDYLRQAQQSMPEAKVAVELTQAQLQLANRQWEQALATLKHLQDLSPQHPYVLKLLMHLYEEIKDWPQLIELLPSLKRHKILANAEFEQLQKKAFLHLMSDLIKQQQGDALTNFIQNLPKVLSNDPDLLKEYCLYLVNKHDEDQAEALLRHSLQKQFNEQLIVLYGKIQGVKSKLSFAESLIKANPHSPGLYLCLGYMSQTNQLWGKAQTYFEESIKLRPTAEAYARLGELLEQLNMPAKACSAYRKGLLLIC